MVWTAIQVLQGAAGEAVPEQGNELSLGPGRKHRRSETDSATAGKGELHQHQGVGEGQENSGRDVKQAWIERSRSCTNRGLERDWTVQREGWCCLPLFRCSSCESQGTLAWPRDILTKSLNMSGILPFTTQKSPYSDFNNVISHRRSSRVKPEWHCRPTCQVTMPITQIGLSCPSIMLEELCIAFTTREVNQHGGPRGVEIIHFCM